MADAWASLLPSWDRDEGRFRNDENLTAFLDRVAAQLGVDPVPTIADVTAYSRRVRRGSRGI